MGEKSVKTSFAPYSRIHSEYLSHGSSWGIFNKLPMMGKALGPGGVNRVCRGPVLTKRPRPATIKAMAEALAMYGSVFLFTKDASMGVAIFR